MQPQLKKLGTSARDALARIGGGEVLLGSVVVLVAVIALGAATLLYMRPLGRTTIAFETTDAASLGVGAEVRVAGITVGKVTDVSIQPDTVRVEADIDEDTFVGDRSRVEVRMLTPVGGYAVTIVPLGDEPLGDKVIPVDQVSVPYSIGDVLQAAPHVTDEIDGGTIDANIEQVATALQQNSASVGSMISGMRSVATVMDRQREQVHTVLALAAEYLRTFNGSREFVFDLIRRIEVLLSTYDNVRVGFNDAYRMLGDLLYRIEPLERFYLGHKDEVLAAVTQLRTSVADFQQHMGPVIDQLQRMRDALAAWLTPEGMARIGGTTISASGICVPIPGRTC